MRHTIILFGIMMLMLLGVATAEVCYTGLSVPQNNKYYWKAITYDGIEDNNYLDYLTKPATITTPKQIGQGYQYTIRIDEDCFDHYLLSNLYKTGIASDQINLQQKDEDYFTQNYLQDKLYTISIPADDNIISTKQVSQISTGVIDSVDYLELPVSFKDAGAHPEVEALAASVCDKNLKIPEQLNEIKLALWSRLTPTSTERSCTQTNIIDCVLQQGKATNKEYATAEMVLARVCGVPVRIAYGISEGTFDGVDLTFTKEKQHYWIEYYDAKWFNLEVTEDSNSQPSSIETNCQDGIDNDKNVMIDCFDPACTKDLICNNWFTTTLFKNSYSTDLTKLPNPYNVNNLTLGNEFGSVTWTNQHVDIRNLQLESVVSIGTGQIRVSDTAPTLNKTATVTLRKLLTKPTSINQDNVTCTKCKITETTNNAITFTIPGTGIYTAQYPNVNATKIVTPPPSAGTSIWTTTKKLWTNTTTSTKIILAIILIGIIWLILRKRH